MKKYVWIDGRFSWYLVFILVYIDASILVTDYLWRIVTTPIETLLTFVLLGNVAVVLVIIVTLLFVRRYRSRSAVKSRGMSA